jgi:hypothetical protein
MSELRIQTEPSAEHTLGPSAAATYRRLRFAGLTERQAGTLVGHLNGLSTVPGGWSIEEVEHLLFVRALVRLGRIGS